MVQILIPIMNYVIAGFYADEYTALLGPLPDLSELSRNAGPVPDSEAASNWEAMSNEEKEAVTRYSMARVRESITEKQTVKEALFTADAILRRFKDRAIVRP